MNLCFSTLGCPDWSWDDILRFGSAYGYQGVEVRGVERELHVYNMPQFQEDAMENTRAQLAQAGLKLVCLSSSCEIQRAPLWDQTRENALRYIDIAQKLGVPFVRVLGDVAPSPMGRVNDLDVRFAARELGEYAADKGVTILIENNGVFADSLRFRYLLDAVAMDNVGALWDINHSARFFGETVETTYENLSPYVRHVHLKDSYGVGRAVQYCSLGDGDLPVERMLSILCHNGYDGFFCFEWPKRWERDLDDPEIALKRFVPYIERYSFEVRN